MISRSAVAHHCVEHDPRTPDICLLAIVSRPVEQHLRRCRVGAKCQQRWQPSQSRQASNRHITLVSEKPSNVTRLTSASHLCIPVCQPLFLPGCGPR